MGLLGVALASSLGFATWQIWVPNVNATNPGNQLGISYTNRSLAFTGVHELPTSWYARVDYADAMETTISTAPGRTVKFSPADLNADGDRLSALLSIPDGKAPIDTNLAAGPYLISITGGVERVGRDGTGYAVIERTRKMTGPVRITVSVARSTGVRLGQGLTELAFWLLVLLALVQAAMVAAKRRRPALTAKRRRSPPVRAP
jgi:hypothetical protein